MNDLKKKDGWHLVGHCAVDAGLIMIGDPCYVNGQNPANELVTGDWMDFCDACADKRNQIDHQVAFSVPFGKGRDGAAVVISSGIGDGYYPVYARFKDLKGWGRHIVEARILFESHPLLGE